MRAQAPRGGQATLARHGADVLVARIAAQAAGRPTRLEQFVYAELERRGIPYRRQQVVRVGGRLRVLAAVVRRRDLAPDAPAGTLVIEPGTAATTASRPRPGMGATTPPWTNCWTRS
ncbi:MAG TPA: hypothetical protein VM536_07505 [Chloroflexia bacterium]|nr:hypothetical protein [Chloroflexia bacterium]